MEKNALFKRCLQFSLGALLLLALWFAGSAAGYTRGFRNGYLDGQQKRQSEEPYFARYSLYDVLPKSFDPAKPNIKDFDSIVTPLMQQTTDTWLSVGGIGESFIDTRSASVVIYNEAAVHLKFAEMLDKMPKHRESMMMPDDGRYSVTQKPQASGGAGYGNTTYGAGSYGPSGYGGGGYGGTTNR